MRISCGRSMMHGYFYFIYIASNQYSYPVINNMFERSNHNLGLQDILVSCEREHQPSQDRKFMLNKSKQLKRIHREMKTEVAKLKSAQDDQSDYDNRDELAITGIQFRNKTSSLQGRLETIRINSERKNQLSQKRKSLTNKTQPSQPKKQSQEKNLLALPEGLSLPKLIRKIRSEKQPKNASKNPSIERKKSKIRDQEDYTYEEIKSQRRKQQENRHLTILGKVMFENYRKQVKQLENRRKLFIRNKFPA